MSDHIKLDPMVGQLVRVQLHELADTLEATILSFDESGYWLKGGSLCEFLQAQRPNTENPDVHHLEFKRIYWIQLV